MNPNRCVGAARRIVSAWASAPTALAAVRSSTPMWERASTSSAGSIAYACRAIGRKNSALSACPREWSDITRLYSRVARSSGDIWEMSGGGGGGRRAVPPPHPSPLPPPPPPGGGTDAERQHCHQGPQRRARHAPGEAGSPTGRLAISRLGAHLGAALVTEFCRRRERGPARLTVHRGREI